MTEKSARRSKHRKRYLRTSEGQAHLRRMIRGSYTHPNKTEKQLDTLLQKYFLGEWRLNVPTEVFIGSKAPDFVNVNGQKVVLELFGSYWHGRTLTGRSKREEELRRIKAFSRWGFRTLIVWESEMRDWERLRTKVESFLHGNS